MQLRRVRLANKLFDQWAVLNLRECRVRHVRPGRRNRAANAKTSVLRFVEQA
jgi:hypothetical protein